MPTENSDDRSMTIVQVANRLGVSRRTVHRRIDEGVLPAFQINPGGLRKHLRIHLRDVIRFEESPE